MDIILARLVLDDRYWPDNDIKFFLNSHFREIAELAHPLNDFIPNEWPERSIINEIVQKSAGQFIHASTVMEYVESIDHCLAIVRNLRSRVRDSDVFFTARRTVYPHMIFREKYITDLRHSCLRDSFLISASFELSFQAGVCPHKVI